MVNASFRYVAQTSDCAQWSEDLSKQDAEEKMPPQGLVFGRRYERIEIMG